jgi:2-dehydropantoate 2-reductase
MTYRARVAQRHEFESALHELEPVLVAGAGAIGTVFGGLLERGVHVDYLGRPEFVAVARRQGVRIDGLFGELTAHDPFAYSDVSELHGDFQTVLLTVKSYDTEEMVRAIAPKLARDGILVCLQNGLGNVETAAAIVGDRRVLGARVIFGAERVGTAHVRVTVNAAPVLVGSPDPSDTARQEIATKVATLFADVGIPSEPTTNLLGELWAKVFYNAALNPLGALLGVPYGHLAADSDTRAIMDDVIDEAFAVARAAGVALPWSDAGTYRAHFYETLVPPTAAHRSSMLQDLERGRPTEIDAINGYVARRGGEIGIDVPANRLLTHLIRARVNRAHASEGR